MVATLEQAQPDGSIDTIVYRSVAILDNDTNWTASELDVGCVVGSISCLRRYPANMQFCTSTDHRNLK